MPTSLKPVTVAEMESLMVQAHMHHEAIMEMMRSIRAELIRLNDR